MGLEGKWKRVRGIKGEQHHIRVYKSLGTCTHRRAKDWQSGHHSPLMILKSVLLIHLQESNQNDNFVCLFKFTKLGCHTMRFDLHSSHLFEDGSSEVGGIQGRMWMVMKSILIQFLPAKKGLNNAFHNCTLMCFTLSQKMEWSTFFLSSLLID